MNFFSALHIKKKILSLWSRAAQDETNDLSAPTFKASPDSNDDLRRSDTLVCVLAETRAHALTWHKFQKNLLQHLKADLAVCIEETETYDYTNPFWTHAKYRWTTPTYEDWGEAYDQAKKDLGSSEDWRVLLKVGKQWLGGIKGKDSQPGSAGILLYFRMFLLRCLQSEDIFSKYKRIIVTRSDFIWDIPHPSLESMDPDAIWIPNGERYGGFTDRHAVLSQSNYEAYLNILHPVLTSPSQLASAMSGRTKWNLEQFIFFSLSRAKSRVKLFPYPAFTVREWGGTTSWSKGQWNFKLNCFVKYASELHEIKKLSSLINEGVTWEEIISHNSLDQHGKWAINSLLASLSHPRLLYKGQIAALTFYGDKGTLGMAKSEVKEGWKVSIEVNVQYKNGKYLLISEKDKKYFCYQGENIIKAKKFSENCLFELRPLASEVEWEESPDGKA